MQSSIYLLWAFLCILMGSSCAKKPENKESRQSEMNNFDDSGILIANLEKGDSMDFKAIRESFSQRNPGYNMNWFSEVKELQIEESNRVVFIQNGGGTATISGEKSSKFSIGDIILLKNGEGLTTDSLFSSLVFQVPDKAPEDIPSFIRPDWDPNITDIPGGCATERNAYRRILLTWADKVGTYLFHSINAHRVRIMDSFSHYHPIEGGFDEFYLVQMVLPEARIITSNQVSLIENPLSVTKAQAAELIQSQKLAVGDLVYLPRGVMHRGLGGVLAQVITIPGFIPGSEIGVDHHLLKINQNLSLTSEKQLPYNKSASLTEVIK